MWSLKRTKELVVAVCEHCGRVCGDACRRAALRERVSLQELWLGVKV
jgi:hypothetical protein